MRISTLEEIVAKVSEQKSPGEQAAALKLAKKNLYLYSDSASAAVKRVFKLIEGPVKREIKSDSD